MVAKRKAQYAAAEDWLNSEIALAQKANNSAYAYNASLKRRVAALDRRIRIAKANRNQTELQSLKAEIGAIRVEVQNQSNSEAQYEKDQGEILGDAKAQGASNFGQYQSLSKSFQQAKAQRGVEVGRLASLDQSIGG
jgi:beta-mannanase